MHRLRPACVISLAVMLWVVVAVAGVMTVAAAGPASSLVAQAATVVVTNPTPIATVPAANPLSTAPDASSAAGTSLASTPAVTGTADTGSAVVPPVSVPVADTSSGPSSGQVIVTLIGVIATLVVIPLGAFGLIRLIATAGKP